MQAVRNLESSRFRRIKHQTLEALNMAGNSLGQPITKKDLQMNAKMSESIKRGTQSTIPSRTQNQTIVSDQENVRNLHKQTMPLHKEIQLNQSIENDYNARMNANNTIQHISKQNFNKRFSSMSQTRNANAIRKQNDKKSHQSFALSFIELQSNQKFASGYDITKNELKNRFLDSESLLNYKNEEITKQIIDTDNIQSKKSPFFKTINLFEDLRKQSLTNKKFQIDNQSQLQFKNFQRKSHLNYRQSGSEIKETLTKNLFKIEDQNSSNFQQTMNNTINKLQLLKAPEIQNYNFQKMNKFPKKLIQKEIFYDLKIDQNENFNFVNHYRNQKLQKLKEHKQNLFYIFKAIDIIQNEESESYKIYIQKLKQIKEVIWTVENLKIEYEKSLINQNINEPAHKNIQEHIIAFPSKNPLISIKEFDQQDQDKNDLLPEQGFDYSKIYETVAKSLRSKSFKQTCQKTKDRLKETDEEAQEQEKDSYNCLQLSKVDKSLIKMEELEIEIKQLIMQASEDILNRIPQVKRRNCEFDAFQETSDKKDRRQLRESQEIKAVQLIKSEEGSYQIEDPIFTMYIQILQMMSNLCVNEDLPGIIIDYYRELKNFKQPVISTFQMERDRKLQEKNNNRNKNSKKNDNSLKSAARDILIRSVIAQLTTKNLQILEFKKKKTNDNDDDLIKLFFKQILQIIKVSFDEELENPRNRKKKSNYIDMAGEQIQKILITAQKMKKDRIEKEKLEILNEQHINQSSKNQESTQVVEKIVDDKKQNNIVQKNNQNLQIHQNDNPQNMDQPKRDPSKASIHEEPSQDLFSEIFTKTNNLIQLLTNLGLNNEKTLQNLLQTRKNTSQKRKGLNFLHYNFSNKNNVNQMRQSEDQSDQQQLSASQIEEKRIQGQLFNYHAKTESQVVRFIDKTKFFLDYLYAEHASLFLFQKSYTMTDIFQFCPQYVIDYADELQQVLTTVPLKYSILTSDYIDEFSWQTLESQEFLFNSDDHTHRLISKSLRNHTHLDSLGEKQQLFWKDEVLKRYNLIALLNFHFRDYIDQFMLNKELKNDFLKSISSEKKNQKSPQSSNKKKKNKSILYDSFEDIEDSYLCQLDKIYFQYEKRKKQNIAIQKNKLKNENEFNKEQIDEILLQDSQIQDEFDIYSSLNKNTRFQLLEIASVSKIQFGEYFVQKDMLVLNKLNQNSNQEHFDEINDCIISFRKEDIFLSLNSEIEIYIGHPQQMKTTKTSFLDRQENQTIQQQIQNSALIDWKIFMTLKKRKSLPMSFLMKLSVQYQCPVKIKIIDNLNQKKDYYLQNVEDQEMYNNSIYAAYFLKFNSYQVSQQLFGNLKNSVYRKTESQIGLDFFFNSQNMDKKSKGESSQKEDQDTSPFIMLVLSIVCQMKVSKYSECVIKKGQIPKALHVIVDGLASVISQQSIMKDMKKSKFCRGEGLFEKNDDKEKANVQRKSPTKIEKSPFMIEFGNMGNDNKKELAPEDKDKKEVKEEIEFKRIKMSDYFGSRVLIDEAVLKNYIKDQKDDIFVWLRPPIKIHIDSVFRNFNSCWLMLSTVKGKLNRSDQSQKYSSNIQIKSKSTNKQGKKKTGTEQFIDPSTGKLGEILDYQKIDSKMVDWDQDIVLKNVQMTKEQFGLTNIDQKNLKSNLAINEEKSLEQNDVSFKESNNYEIQIKNENQNEILNNKEYQLMKNYLLTSQLSVVVKSHELKCMLIRKSDKVFFEEKIKKIFDEKMKIYEFVDIDRPYKHLKFLEATKLNYMKWDLFKNQYENMILEEGYIQRKESFNFSKNI